MSMPLYLEIRDDAPLDDYQHIERSTGFCTYMGQH